jgi:hypothetical protein
MTMAKITDIEKRIRRNAKDKKPPAFRTPKAPPVRTMADLGAAAVATMIKAKNTGDQVSLLANALDEMRAITYTALAIADTARLALEARVSELEAQLGIEVPLPTQEISDDQIHE